jgi:aspartyl-tRNA(Asn)/glutamyl-tRNA(Gln) amidotransferase subunit A
VATGLCAASYGTDTGGSIRSPSSFNGVVGLKPTYGRVSRYGVIPLSYSCDHCGPMTRTVEDCAIMLQAVAGHDPHDPTSSHSPVSDYLASLDKPVKGLKVGILRDFYTQPKGWVVPEVLDAVDTAIAELTRLGCHVRDIKIPCLDYTRIAHNVIMMSEGLTYHIHNLRSQPQNYGPLLHALLLSSTAFSGADYVKAQQVRAQAKAEFMAALQSVDVLVSPTANNTAPLIQDPDPIALFAEKSMTSHYDLTGLPAVTVRCGMSKTGLPIGLQIASRPFDESTILHLAHHYQQATPWHLRQPPL